MHDPTEESTITRKRTEVLRQSPPIFMLRGAEKRHEKLFEKIRLMTTEFHRMTEELVQAYADVDTEIAESEIQEALEESREQ